MRRIHYLLLAGILLVACGDQANIHRALKTLPQDVAAFVAAKTPLYQTDQQARRRAFLANYFSPWTTPEAFNSKTVIRQIERRVINIFEHRPNWSSSRQMLTRSWLVPIVKNMHLATFPNLRARAITVRASAARMLPTKRVVYGDPHKAGEGYRFDRLQVSLIKANVPLYIWHTSRDGAWSLVSTPWNFFAWVKSADVARVSPAFVRKWQHAKFVVVTKDDEPIFNAQQKRYQKARLAELFPLQKITRKAFHILIALSTNNNEAQMVHAQLAKQHAAVFPLSARPSAVATIANHLLGNPYGWGGRQHDRDCSSTMQDIFTPFAIWLPRNSADQAKAGKYVDLSQLTAKKKHTTIITQGVPFFTLVWMHGHIMLYIGHKQGKAYVLHDAWGLKTRSFWGVDGRAIINSTVITPLDFDQQFSNVPLTWLDRTQGISVLVNKRN